MNSAKTDIYIRVTNQSKIKTFDSENKYREWDFGEISLLILVIFGAVTNFLTVIVMTRKRMRSSNASLYIVYIAVCDFIVLLLRFLANMIKLYRIAIYNFCILNQIVAQAASFISVWLILATSAERTAAVIFPLKVTHIFSRKRSKKIILGLVLIFVFISSTVSFCIEYSRAKPHYCQIKGSLNGTCFKYYTLIFPWFRSALGSWIPSVLGFIFSLIIIKALSNASIVRKSITNQMYVKFRPMNIENQIFKSNESSRLFKLEEFKLLLMKKNHSYNSSYTADGSLASKRSSSWRTLSSLYSIQLKERQISIMLLTISISFVLLTFPYSIFDLFRKFGLKSNFLKNRVLLRSVMFLIDLNHSTNFVLFCLTARRFRIELKNIFREIYLKMHKNGLFCKKLNKFDV